MHDPVALVSIPTTSQRPARLAAAEGARHPLALCGFGAIALLAMGFLTAGMPAVSVCLLAVSGISSFVLGSALGCARDPGRSAPRRVAAEDILSSEVRASYGAILGALDEVEQAVREAPGLGGALAPVAERCRTAVDLAGKIALLANPLQRYLDLHDAAYIRSSLDRLRARAELSSDDGAVGAWSHAVAARARQLATLDQMAAKRDQICARLALVHAALESFAAALIRLHALGEEQIALAGESVASQLDELGEDLEVLESALELDASA